LRVSEARQKEGYSVEIRVPFKRVAGYRPGDLGLALQVTVADSDRRDGRVKSAMTSGHGRVTFTRAKSGIDGFLRDLKAGPKDVRLHLKANVVGDRRLEHVLLVKGYVGIAGQGVPSGGYFYFHPPVRSPDDVRWVKLADLNGDAKAEVLVRYLERASNGRREIVAVYRYDSGGRFSRSFAHEVLKARGSRTLSNRLRWVPRRQKRGRRIVGHDIIVDKPTAHGFDRHNFVEDPSNDVFPILLPWGKQQRRVFRFEADEFSQR
jgi:hypothetical protein